MKRTVSATVAAGPGERRRARRLAIHIIASGQAPAAQVTVKTRRGVTRYLATAGCRHQAGARCSRLVLRGFVCLRSHGRLVRIEAEPKRVIEVPQPCS